jgi:hypothetical protein
MDSLERTPGSNNAALLDALRALEAFGVSFQDAVMMGSGRFPIGAQAYYRDDFGEPRSGPPPHPHAGNDIWAEFDAPLRSPADGVIRFEDSGLGGKGAFVTEADGTYYYLAHLNAFAPGLSNGDRVRVGQLIGFNGDSGNARGGPPHVHFEIHPKGGAAVNPKPILDRWLAEALAAVPDLVAPYRQTTAVAGTRPLTAVGLARYFDRGLMAGPSRSGGTRGSDDSEDAPLASRVVADALVAPLSPPVLRAGDQTALR